MRNYEIVLMIHPDYGDQISNLVNRYIDMITNSQGKIHRIENWGRRQLSYTIKNLNKAYYILLNIEVCQKTIDALNQDFRFNDIIFRNIIMRTKHPINSPSSLIRKKEDILEGSEVDFESHIKKWV